MLEKTKTNNLKNVSNSTEQGKTPNNLSFIKEGVEYRKDKVLKIKCEGAITSTGLSNEEFYTKSKIPRQRWYHWSWGLEPFPNHIKIRLCDEFGKPFRDLFLQINDEEVEE